MPEEDRPRQGSVIDVSQSDPRWGAFADFIHSRVSVFVAALELRDVEVSVHLCDDAEIATLNTHYRHKSEPTNVLSFPAAGSPVPNNAVELLGDIILAYDTIMREAEEQGKSAEAHIAHLLAHGLLHLLGYDHIEEEEASIMEQCEIDLLQRLGYANPYLLGDAAQTITRGK